MSQHESKYARKQRIARETADMGKCPHGIQLTRRCTVCQPDVPTREVPNPSRIHRSGQKPQRTFEMTFHDEIEVGIERTKLRGGLYNRGRRPKP